MAYTLITFGIYDNFSLRFIFQAYYEEHQHLFVNVHKWQELFQRMLELETRARDVNRYSNRGGKLLQEEKERKKIQRQLPKIEDELFGAIES